MELEEEFEHYIFKHKSLVILTALLIYYKDLQLNEGINIETNIQDILNILAEQKAQKHYLSLLRDQDKFNNIYEQSWIRYGSLLP